MADPRDDMETIPDRDGSVREDSVLIASTAAEADGATPPAFL